MTLTEVAGSDPRLTACQRAYFAEISRRFGVCFDPDAGSSDDVLQARDWHVLAVGDREALGCGSLRDLGNGIGEVKRVWVSESARGKGIGHKIMDWLEEKARAEDFSIVRLDTNNTLSEAQALYHNRGYRVIPRYNDNPYADDFFEKVL